MPNEAALERLNDAHQSWVRSWVRLAIEPQAAVRAESRLFDACIEAGMSHDEPDHCAWASERVARWLVDA